MEKSFLHFVFQAVESWKVMEVDLLFLDFLPQFFDRVVVRRIGRQIEHGQTVRFGFEESLHGLAGVAFGPILNQNNVLSRF